MKSDRWLHAFVVTWLIVVGVVARWSGLGHYALSPDDMLILGIAQSESLGALIENAMREVHPPLFYITLRFFSAISADEMFLRAAMTGLGLLAVPIVYATGLRFVGVVGAMAMALLPALAIGPVLETTSLRHYPLVILLSSAGFYLFLRYRETRSTKHLVLYGVVVFAGVLTHYSQLLLFVALSLVHFIDVLRDSGTRKQTLPFVAAQIPAAIAALFFVWTHISAQWTKGQGHYDYIVNVAYEKIFPKDVGHWLRNTAELGTWLSFPNIPGLVALALAVTGLLIIPKRKGVTVLVAILCVVAFQLIGTLSKSYPFGATRHCLYLLPLFAFAFGFGVQALVLLVLGKRARTNVPARAGLGLVVVASLWFTFDYVNKNSYRDIEHAPAELVNPVDSRYWSHASFPVVRQDLETLMAKLDEHVRPGMHIFTNRQSSMYLRYAMKQISGTQVNGVLYKIRYREADFYYLDDRSVMHQPQQLGEVVSGVANGLQLRGTETLYLFTVGWNQSVIEALAAQPAVQDTVLDYNSSGALLRIRLDRLMKFLPR